MIDFQVIYIYIYIYVYITMKFLQFLQYYQHNYVVLTVFHSYAKYISTLFLVPSGDLHT
jgi:hypothetical protein